jgi:hypothetical protein
MEIAACKESRNPKQFSELLAVILLLVNDINGVEGGVGFILDSPSKLSEVS